MPSVFRPSFRRRTLLSAAGAFALPAQAATEGWPSQPIRLVTPFPAGAVSDSAARAMAQILAPKLGQPVVVENRPGVGGGLGAQQALAARADGHTLLLVNNSVLTMVPRVSQIRFDPTQDFAPVAFLGESFNILAVNRDLPVRSLGDFAALARGRPGDFVYASPGVGSYGHVAGELLQRRLGIELLHAPFAGIVPAINAVLAGQAHAVMGPNAMPFVQSGQLRGLAVIAEVRWPAVPDVPLLPEAGIAEWPLDFWYAVVAPAGTPRPILERLNRAIAEAVATPQLASLLDRVGMRAQPRPIDDLAAMIARDWRAVGTTLTEIGFR